MDEMRSESRTAVNPSMVSQDMHIPLCGWCAAIAFLYCQLVSPRYGVFGARGCHALPGDTLREMSGSQQLKIVG
jgi:hypothetical protein